MKLTALLLALTGFALFIPRAQADTFHYKATALFPVQDQIDDPNPHLVGHGTIDLKIGLGTKEIINLAPGLPVDTKVPSNIVLAVAVDHNLPNDAKLVLYDKDTLTELGDIILINGVQANTQSKDLGNDDVKAKANGLGTGDIQARGNATDGLVATTINLSATGTNVATPVGPTFTIKVTGMIGPFKAHIDGTLLDGLLINGSFTAGGKAIDHF